MSSWREFKQQWYCSQYQPWFGRSRLHPKVGHNSISWLQNNGFDIIQGCFAACLSQSRGPTVCYCIHWNLTCCITYQWFILVVAGVVVSNHWTKFPAIMIYIHAWDTRHSNVQWPVVVDWADHRLDTERNAPALGLQDKDARWRLKGSQIASVSNRSVSNDVRANFRTI